MVILEFFFQIPIKQKVRYEPRATRSKSTSSKDGQNIVDTVLKKQPPKAVDIPSSSKTSYTVKNGGTKFPTSSSTIPTYNPYDMLARESDPENSTRNGGDLIQDYTKSEEEVENVIDELVNLSSNFKTGAN
uniref:Uncharacterized protein n=1 Tax=Tanacetum cinerariifolium TaxID=118510 RepID=A0A6L2LU77_TANCI|nr:hypothetical protein [Tanacetum cinerariifolium]